MKKIFTTLCAFTTALLFILASCTTEPGVSNNDNETADSATTTLIDTTPSLSPPNCVVQGQVLEGNRLWLLDMDLLAVIKADESTTVDDVPSHKILELLDGRSCEVKFTTTLPENVSPDFPYYLANIQYNKGSHLLGIQAYYDIYICDLDNENKISKLSPEFYSERMFDDPQSGMIRRIEVWENYLLGYAQDVGPFIFDLNDTEQPKPIIPFAEWQNMDNGAYHSLFLLETPNGYQAIMPDYNFSDNKFILNPIFEKPQQLSLNVPKNVRNNKQLVLRGNSEAGTVFAIDLGKRKALTLPDDVAKQNTQAILKWMKAQ